MMKKDTKQRLKRSRQTRRQISFIKYASHTKASRTANEQKKGGSVSLRPPIHSSREAMSYFWR